MLSSANPGPVDVQLLRREAIRFHQSGNLAHAEQAYLKILATAPDDFGALHLLGVVRFQQGRASEALDLIGRALALQPDDAEALTNYGLALYAASRPNEALESYDKALAVNPAYALAWNNRGNALKECKRLSAALENFDEALALRPDYADAWTNRGIVLRELGRLEEAVASYDRALALRPDHAGAFYNLGNVLVDLGRSAEALASYNQTLRIDPRNCAAWFNRGNTLRQLNRLPEALASFERLLGINPGDTEAWNNAGIALKELGRFEDALKSHERALTIKVSDAASWYNKGRVLQELRRWPEALASYDRSVALEPGFSAGWNNRGNVLRRLRRRKDALASYEKALALKPDFVEALNNRGNTLQDLKRFDEALMSFDAALASRPQNADALFNRGTTLLHLNRLKESLADQQHAVAADPDHKDALGGLANTALQLCDWRNTAAIAKILPDAITKGRAIIPPFVLLGYSGDPALQLECAKRYVADKVSVPLKPLWQGTPDRRGKIRVAYLSSDFRQHPVAHQMVNVLEAHDRSHFDIIGVCLGNDDGSDIRARITRACDRFIEVGDKSDREAAELLRALGVDIAVDLNGHTQDARPIILAHHPAPVQVNYLGFPATLGAGFIDYVIGDETVTPFEWQSVFAEKIVQLPGSFFPPGPQPAVGVATPTRAQLGLPEDCVVFCCFNSSWKITAALFDIWMRLLGKAGGSVLWLKAGKAGVQENLIREAAARGIDSRRLIFAVDVGRDEHMARYGAADIFLDTLPYCAHATASDVLAAGLPMLTCVGDSFSGRVAASLLRALKLGELVAPTLEDYERLALDLARNPSRLAAIRRTLHHNRFSFFDSAQQTRHLEAAYATMLEIDRNGEVPASFRVDEAPDCKAGADEVCRQGIALWNAGAREDALAHFDRTVRADPDSAEAWNNRSAALQGLNRAEDALAGYDTAITIKPAYVEAHFNRGDVLSHLKRFADALAAYDRVLELAPDHASAWVHRGTTLWEMKRLDDACAAYDQALRLDPANAEALYKRGMLWAEKRDLAVAIGDLEQAVAIDPERNYARGDLLHLSMQCADWRDFDGRVAAIDAAVREGRRAVQPFVYLAISNSPADIRQCSETFTAHQYPAAPQLFVKSDHNRTKIRIGYVSGEFREQATAYLTAGLFELHDKSKFEIVAFDNGHSDGGHTRSRLESSFDRLVSIAEISDQEAAERIRDQKIDILVNLNGYFGRQRMGVFARRPAPIQINYLGFPGTLGADYIDYIVTDRIVTPDGSERHYAEKIVRLPGTYQANDYLHRTSLVPTRQSCGLPARGFVFCNFNQSYKLTPTMFAAWMRILKAVDGSVLWLLQNNEYFPRNLRREAERCGIDPGRLIFAPLLPHTDHLARLGLADLFLDSLPHNAHTTASDALWAGVPILTCMGESFAGRVAASLLYAAELPQLVTASLVEYEAHAVSLAARPDILGGLRQKLVTYRASAFDTDRFRRHIEVAFSRMWEIYRHGHTPYAFDVLPLPGNKQP